MPALRLHERSNSVLAAGVARLNDDLDALAGSSEAAVSGKGMMHYGRLAVVRSPVDGPVYRVSIKTELAAQQQAQIGSIPGCPAGGIWRFGIGPDHLQYKAAMSSHVEQGADTNGMKTEGAKPTPRSLNRGH